MGARRSPDPVQDSITNLDPQEPLMKILYINNDGSGFADYLEVPAGTTVDTLFGQQIPHGKTQDYLIRVNRQPVPRNYELVEGDRVSFTPTKIEGAWYKSI